MCSSSLRPIASRLEDKRATSNQLFEHALFCRRRTACDREFIALTLALQPSFALGSGYQQSPLRREQGQLAVLFSCWKLSMIWNIGEQRACLTNSSYSRHSILRPMVNAIALTCIPNRIDSNLSKIHCIPSTDPRRTCHDHPPYSYSSCRHSSSTSPCSHPPLD